MSRKLYHDGIAPKWKRRPCIKHYSVRETLRIVLTWAYWDWYFGKRGDRPPKWIPPK